MKRFLVSVAAIALLLVGCSAPESGRVVGKNFDPAHSTPSTTTNCVGTGTERRCYSSVSQQYHGNSWRLKLDNGQDSGWREVTPEEYDRYQVGDQYP